MDLHDFYTGRAFDAYEYFGAHPVDGGVVFRVYAPAAVKVALKGDFSGWEELEMGNLGGGVWEYIHYGAKTGDFYKYVVYAEEGWNCEHCDPYGFSMELRPGFASRVADLRAYRFSDNDWLNRRPLTFDRPLNIYELHLGSWKKKGEGETDWYTYEEIADRLIPYILESGYTHIELMPLSEHPADASWGYQNTGFFAPTSRYGEPWQLQRFVDRCHQAGIGVLMDFVPVHFALDGYGLAKFDGTCLYEYPHDDVGYSEWGSKNFIHSRGEAASFLNSAAAYWLDLYHMDGLRVDAVSRLLYWQGDENRGENQKAIRFLKRMNKGLKERFPACMLIAEDSSAYPHVTWPAQRGGLGFDYKWDLGWMHDTLDFFRTPPTERREKYHKLTFSMMYFYSENYLLPLSHDEVVHGKATILQKMWGDLEEKFPQARAMYLYMLAHPGKKLNFMGNEIGQLREWDEKREQDWFIRQYPSHDAFYRFIRDLNRVYAAHRSLWEGDYDPRSFLWLEVHGEEKCVYAFLRGGFANKDVLWDEDDPEEMWQDDRLDRTAAVFNFSGVPVKNYRLNLPHGFTFTPILSSDRDIYGGKTTGEPPAYTAKRDQKGIYITLDLPAYSGVLYEATPITLPELPKPKPPVKKGKAGKAPAKPSPPARR